MDSSKYRFPLRAKNERANVDIDALDAPQSAAADPLGDAGEALEGVDPNDMGTSTLGPLHRGMYGRDRRGQKFPVDQWGVRVTLQHTQGVLYRPEGITQEAWRTADAALRAEWVKSFPRRVQGREPEGEPAKVTRRRELEKKRAGKKAKSSANAAIAMVGIGSLLDSYPGGPPGQPSPESSDEEALSICNSDSGAKAPRKLPSASAKLADALN